MGLAHHNLVVWQRADDFFIEVHGLTHQRFPRHERFEPSSQLRRAAYSVPSNIVEGIARRHRREAIRFFDIAGASLSELGYGLHAPARLGYITAAELATLEEKLRLHLRSAQRVDTTLQVPGRAGSRDDTRDARRSGEVAGLTFTAACCKDYRSRSSEVTGP
jgi:four helix bundle protein